MLAFLHKHYEHKLNKSDMGKEQIMPLKEYLIPDDS